MRAMNTTESRHFDVIIVGGGMVGATMASLLHQLPLRIALLDRARFDSTQLPFQQAQPCFDPRVSALTSASKALFSRLDVWQQVESARCCDYQNMDVWDADGTGAIYFSAAEINHPALGTIVENSIINAALYAKLQQQDNLELMAPEEVASLEQLAGDSPGAALLTTSSGLRLSASLVIAADGANSRIRQLANFNTREWEYQHQALVTTVRTEHPHQHTALQRFMQTGPLAFLPLSLAADSVDEHYCSIVWSAVPQRAQQLMALDDEQFGLELARNIEHRLGKIEWSGQRFCFPLRQRHATDYVQDSVVLIGDAAHTIHPLAGQGANLGLLDAAALAQELERAHAAGRKLNDAVVLGRYQRQRIGHNLGMMWLMEGFKHLFAEEALPVRWLRNLGMTSMDKLPLIKNQLARRAMGLDGF
jgi:2-polyprenylphenol 6-hydroxylase